MKCMCYFVATLYIFILHSTEEGEKILETFQLNNRMLKSKEDVSMDKYY
ncbi:hypothetical protein ABH955_003246 [Bacillus sp. RC240]|uniref:Uncharacterized protein n=1 Tax=Bacillus cereus HuA2-1 TaxID=1053201 RepID=J9C9L6_BACCE|nr:hypothetical protein IG3_01201 [Bacillus cereus HuA2-1]EOO16478.1 hypothetical protein IG9_03238 [Bacillus cereus HuA2-9]